MEKLFDVAHANCDKEKSTIKIPDDINFLEDQRGPRKMTVDKEDLHSKDREEKGSDVRQKKRDAEKLH